jgi:hypothetical protein
LRVSERVKLRILWLTRYQLFQVEEIEFNFNSQANIIRPQAVFTAMDLVRLEIMVEKVNEMRDGSRELQSEGSSEAEWRQVISHGLKTFKGYGSVGMM